MRREFLRSGWIENLEERELLSSVVAKIRVLGNETTIQAGNAVHGNALQNKSKTGTVLGAGTPLTAQYRWDFGDRTDSSRYNVLPGFNAAHVYDTPGTYKLTLRITNELGGTGTASRIINVLPSQRCVIYINARGNDRNDGRSPDTAVRSIGRAQKLIDEFGNDTDILFRRDRSYSFPFALALNHRNMHVGAYGKGAAPLLQLPETGTTYPSVFIMNRDSHQILIEDVVMESIANRMAGEAVRPDGDLITIRDSFFSNLHSSIMNNRSPVGVLAYDNVSGTTAGYFIFDQGSDHVYLGNRAGDSVGQHNIRIYASRVLCYGNDLSNNPVGSGIHSLRVNQGSFNYWARNTVRGGLMMVGPLNASISADQASRNVDTVVIENNRWEQLPGLESNIGDRIRVNAGASGVMIRNNILSANNALGIVVDTYQLQKPAGAQNHIERLTKAVAILNNTVINIGAKGSLLEVNGTGTGVVTLKNNLYVAPNLAPGPFTTSAVRILGRRDMSNFTSLATGGGVDNNVWPRPGNSDNVGVNWVSAGGIALNSYRTPAEWMQDFPDYIGSGERFERVGTSELIFGGAPPANLAFVGSARPAPGVFGDFNGFARADGQWTAGAIQVGQIAPQPTQRAGSSDPIGPVWPGVSVTA